MSKIDANVFSHLGQNQSTTGTQENYCPCGKPAQRCSLNVKREGAHLLYNCFSAGCSVGGGRIMVDVHTKQPEATALPKEKVIKIDFSDSTHRLPDAFKEWLAQYRITRSSCSRYGIKYNKKYNRIVFPVRDSMGDVIANTARDIRKGAYVKWLHDRSLNEYCFTSATNAMVNVKDRRIGIIVEDPISAIVSGMLTPTLALLGTNYRLKWPYIKQWIEANNLDKIVVCLDRDAYDKCGKLTNYLINKGVLAVDRLVDKDLKECTDEEIIDIIKGE